VHGIGGIDGDRCPKRDRPRDPERRATRCEEDDTMANRHAKTVRGAPAGWGDVEKGVHQLTRSAKDIERSLHRAERKIEAEARDRVRKLRKEARAQLAVLRGHQREARRLLTRLSTAADGSWGDLKGAADRALSDARAVADSMIVRFRRAVAE
jgi:hypothetical protein